MPDIRYHMLYVRGDSCRDALDMFMPSFHFKRFLFKERYTSEKYPPWRSLHHSQASDMKVFYQKEVSALERCSPYRRFCFRKMSLRLPHKCPCVHLAEIFAFESCLSYSDFYLREVSSLVRCAFVGCARLKDLNLCHKEVSFLKTFYPLR